MTARWRQPPARHRLHLATLGRRRELVASSTRYLTRDDDGVDHLVVVLGVVHGQHLEPAPPNVRGLHDRAQEAASPVGAPDDEGRAVGHVLAEVRYHAGLLLGRCHADARRQERARFVEDLKRIRDRAEAMAS